LIQYTGVFVAIIMAGSSVSRPEHHARGGARAREMHASRWAFTRQHSAEFLPRARAPGRLAGYWVPAGAAAERHHHGGGQQQLLGIGLRFQGQPADHGWRGDFRLCWGLRRRIPGAQRVEKGNSHGRAKSKIYSMDAELKI
jgi:hypothetical protein